MAKYLTFIADAELESKALKAISAINGELVGRGVSMQQVKAAEARGDVTLITSRNINFHGKTVLIDRTFSIEELAGMLAPEKIQPQFNFESAGARVSAFVGLSGGVGTTSLAINYAFEQAKSRQVDLIDLTPSQSDLATVFGLHRIEHRFENVTQNLRASQGLPRLENLNRRCEQFVFDLGTQLTHPLLTTADQVYLVARVSGNTLNRLKELTFTPVSVLLNFVTRSKIEQSWLQQIKAEYPRFEFKLIPLDWKSFEAASYAKSALLEIAANSPARKAIANLA